MGRAVSSMGGLRMVPGGGAALTGAGGEGRGATGAAGAVGPGRGGAAGAGGTVAARAAGSGTDPLVRGAAGEVDRGATGGAAAGRAGAGSGTASARMVVPVVERASGSGTAVDVVTAPGGGVGADAPGTEAICTWITFPQWQR